MQQAQQQEQRQQHQQPVQTSCRKSMTRESHMNCRPSFWCGLSICGALKACGRAGGEALGTRGLAAARWADGAGLHGSRGDAGGDRGAETG